MWLCLSSWTTWSFSSARVTSSLPRWKLQVYVVIIIIIIIVTIINTNTSSSEINDRPWSKSHHHVQISQRFQHNFHHYNMLKYVNHLLRPGYVDNSAEEHDVRRVVPQRHHRVGQIWGHVLHQGSSHVMCIIVWCCCIILYLEECIAYIATTYRLCIFWWTTS